MDRRSCLSASGAAVTAASAAALPAPEAERQKDWTKTPEWLGWVKDTADEVEAFMAVAEAIQHRPGYPSYAAMSVPFACLPVNAYVRAYDEVVRRAPPCPNIEELAKVVRFGHGRQGMADVMKELWSRWKPSYYHEVRDYPSRPEMRRKYEDAKAKKHPGLLSDRVITPRFTIDVDELDVSAMVNFLSSVKGIAQELDARFKTTIATMVEMQKVTGVFPMEGDGWISPLEVYSDTQEVDAAQIFKPGAGPAPVIEAGISIQKTAFLLEVFSCVVASGTLYPINDRYTKGVDAAENAAWLASRRAEPTHWHKMPFPMENKA